MTNALLGTWWEWALFGACVGLAVIGVNAGVRAAKISRLQAQYRPTGRTILGMVRDTGKWDAERPGGASLTVNRTETDPERWAVVLRHPPGSDGCRITSVAVELTADQAADLAGEWWWRHAR